MALKHWLLATRIKTLPAGMSPVLVGLAGAQAVGFYDSFLAAITLACSLLIQIGTNFANDYYDALKGTDTDQRKGPTRMVQSGFIRSGQMKYATAGVFALAFITGIPLMIQGGWGIALIGIVGIILGYLYTAGPYALAYLGLGDSCVLLFFGPIGVLGTYYLQTHTMSYEGIWVGLGIGCIATALLAVNNVRDYEEDKQANKRTIVVRFGETVGRIEYIICMVIPCIVLVIYAGVSMPYIGAGIWIFIALALKGCVDMWRLKETALNKLLGFTGILGSVYTFIYGASVLWG